tara:strand:- start:172 stop:432 length:261 start_codon:yes stop_codon:yes gene_type:complete
MQSESKKKDSWTFTVILEPAEEGGCIATVPFLGIATEGETVEEARSMAEDAIVGYLECLQQEGQPIPKEPAQMENQVFVESIQVAL